MTGLAYLARHSLLAAILALAAPMLPAAFAADTKPGSLVIIGGALRFDDPAVWTRMVDLAGGKGTKVSVIPTASGSPKKNGQAIVDAFKRYGADAMLVPLALNAKKMDDLDYQDVRRDPKWVEAIKRAGLVFFIGGTQERIVKALYEVDGSRSPMLQAIWDVYESGGVVAGS